MLSKTMKTLKFTLRKMKNSKVMTVKKALVKMLFHIPQLEKDLVNG